MVTQKAQAPRPLAPGNLVPQYSSKAIPQRQRRARSGADLPFAVPLYLSRPAFQETNQITRPPGRSSYLAANLLFSFTVTLLPSVIWLLMFSATRSPSVNPEETSTLLPLSLAIRTS